MGISIDSCKVTTNNLQTGQNEIKCPTSDVEKTVIFKTKKNDPKTDLENNGKFDLPVFGKNIIEGLKKPFKDVVNYAKENPLQAALITTGAIGLTIAAGSSAIVAGGLMGVGFYFIGRPLFNAGVRISNAKNGDDYEKVGLDLGESATYAALTFAPKILPKPHPSHGTVLRAIHAHNHLHTNIWSNATDIASFGPRFAKTMGVLDKS